MSFSLPKIYPITDPLITKLSHLEQVERLIAGGAKFIQLRDKHSTPQDFYESAQAVMNFVRGKDVKIIINDRVDIASLVQADGVHLGQDDLPPEQARLLLGKKAIIGFSTHNLSQAIQALNLRLDYIAFGPVYVTSTKDNPDPVVGLAGLKKVRSRIGNFPLVAIGGINSQNASQVLHAGADSVALISQILRDPANIPETYRNFVKQLQK